MPNSPPVRLAGGNATRIWGMSIDERTRRMARAAGLALVDTAPAGAGVIINRAFVFDPPWLRHHAATPGAVLTIGGVPVIAHPRDAAEAEVVAAAIAADRPISSPGALAITAYEDGGTLVNAALRKRERPFAMRLAPDTVRTAERASYFGAYKGVTDILTKYLWPEWALVLTRAAARIGMTPNQVTLIGFILCVAATLLFARGLYWPGMAAALGFMVLDTVDGKLARCTITSSKWGNVFDHGIDLVHPPFWWAAWGIGLAYYGQPLPFDILWGTIAIITIAYILQRLVEGAFLKYYAMDVHVWRPFDSWFRLITARRNPNMVVLFVATLFGRPDLGLLAVALWTVASLVVHLVQFVQARLVIRAGGTIRSWLI